MTSRRLPTWLKVAATGGGVIVVVGLVALLGLLVPPVGDAIRQAPVVVVVLVVGTILVLGSTIRAALRRRPSGALAALEVELPLLAVDQAVDVVGVGEPDDGGTGDCRRRAAQGG